MSEEAALPKGLVNQLPAKWNTLCSRQKSSRFAWAHNGTNAGNAWVQLLASGKLHTKWGTGKWEADKKDDCIHMIFGSVRHVCYLRDGDRFEVTERVKEKTGKQLEHPKAKGVEVFTAGWPISEIPQEVVKASPAKRKVTPASAKDGAEDAAESTPAKRARKEKIPAINPLEGFNVFLILAQAQASRDRKAVRPNAVMARIQKVWEGLDEENQQIHAQEFKTLKTQYKQAMKLRKQDPESSPGPATKETEKADEVALPKRPVGGAYNVFVQEKRPEILQAATSPEERSMGAVSKRMKELWDGLDDDQKRPFQEQYATRKKAYDEAVEEHKKVVQQRKQATQGGS